MPKIAGEIRRFLRDDGAVKVSRGLKEQGALIRGARSQLWSTLGREPALSELAQATGLTPEEIAAAETAADPVVSLQAETGEGGLTLEGVLSAGGMEEGLVERIACGGRWSSCRSGSGRCCCCATTRGSPRPTPPGCLGCPRCRSSRLERRAVDRLRQVLLPP